MAAPRPWTVDDTARMVRLHAEGVTLTGIAKDLNRSKAVVSKYAALQVPPLAFDRTYTEAATHAKIVDAKARRAQLSLRFLEASHTELDKLDDPHIAYAFGGRDNVYTEHVFKHPPSEIRERIMRTAGTAALRHLDIVKHDTEIVRDMPAVDQWLQHMMGGGNDGRDPTPGQGADSDPA